MIRASVLVIASVLFSSRANAKPLPTIAAKTAQLQKRDGLFPTYWDAAGGVLYLEIPRLDWEVLYQTGLATGVGSSDLGLDRGELVGTHVVSFQRSGPKILMVESNYGFRARSQNPRERADVDDGFAKSTLWGFTIEAESDGHVLVDATDFVVRDAVDAAARLRPVSYHYDNRRSAIYLPNTKGFPRNTELEATITLVSDGPFDAEAGAPGGRPSDVAPSTEAITLREHHSLVQLPDPGYTPRAFDPRSGFFDFQFQDFAAPLGADTRVRYLPRHRLIKKDPSAATSDPVEPIIYYVDRGAPDDIRRALVDGASWWNTAFEAAGFHDAFHVALLPEGVDPMDVRYNTITWVHRATRGWSYGASIVDPRTGEIIKGQVLLGSLRAQQDFLIGEGLTSPYATGDEHPQALADLALARLRQLAAHEVGHTLGLAHQYYDSSKGRISVMDYPHPLVAIGTDGSLDLSQAYATGIGDWDKISIAYGYGQFRPADQASALAKILDDAAANDLRFFTDQDVGANPRVDRWSNGTDQAAELVRVLAIRDAALAKLGDASIPKDRPMATIEDVLVPLYLHHRYSVEAAAHAVGGQSYVYARRGDGQTPTAWVAAADQKAALDALVRTIAPGELALPKPLLAKIPPRPIGYYATREDFPRATGGVFDPLAPPIVGAELTIGVVLEPERAARLVAQKAIDGKLPGLEDVVERLIAAAFDSRSNGTYEAEIARSTQRVLVSQLMTLASASPSSEVRAIAMHELAAIAARSIPGGLPTAEAAHRELLHADIKRFADRPTDAATRILPAQPLPPGAPIGSAQWAADSDE